MINNKLLNLKKNPIRNKINLINRDIKIVIAMTKKYLQNNKNQNLIKNKILLMIHWKNIKIEVIEIEVTDKKKKMMFLLVSEE